MSAAVASPRNASSAAGVALASLHVPDGPLQFQGLVPYPPVAVSSSAQAAAVVSGGGRGGGGPSSAAASSSSPSRDDWGLTLEQQVTAVERFRALLDARGQWSRERHDYYGLLRFLRARNYDLDKAGRMWQDTLEWRAQLGADGMLGPLGGGLGGGATGGGGGGATGGGGGGGSGGAEGGFVFHEREQFLMAYPQGYHKTDKMVRPFVSWPVASFMFRRPPAAHRLASPRVSLKPKQKQIKTKHNRAGPSTSSSSAASTSPPSAPSPPRTAWSSSTSRSTSAAPK